MFDLKSVQQNYIRFENYALFYKQKITIVILIHKCKNLTLMRWHSLPTLSSLAAAQPGSSVQQLIQLNYTYFIFAFVKLKDKY